MTVMTLHIVEGYYGFMFVVPPSVVGPSVFSFQDDNLSKNINGFLSNLVCALILWRPGSGLLTGKFCHFFTELPAQVMPLFSFPNNNLSLC